MDTEKEIQLEEEIRDDAVIEQAIKWSLRVFLILILVGVSVWWSLREKPIDEILHERASIQAPAKLTAQEELFPQVSFKELKSFPSFHITNGATGEKLLPETMGTGAAVLDYNLDGIPDLLFVNGTLWPENKTKTKLPTQRLFQGDGKAGFVDVTSPSGLARSFYGQGVAVGDVDNDGDPDLFITAVGPNHFFINDHGVFKEKTDEWGLRGDDQAWSTSAGFFDLENDGDLDLFVCNYIVWSRDLDLQQNFSLNGSDRAYGPPTGFEGTHCYLYRNDGGQFTDISEPAGIQQFNPATGKPLGKSLSVTFVDIDKDNLLDILVANDTVQNFVFHNLGDGTFEEMGLLSGIAFDHMGAATGAMGIDSASLTQENQLSIGIANFANQSTSLYVQQMGDPWLFADMSNSEGVGSPSRLRLSFGLFFFDYDLDGRLDLLQANGHLENEIQQVQSSQSYKQPAQLFWNTGNPEGPCFSEVPTDRTGDLSNPIVGRGAAFGDLDQDGDLDVVLTESAGSPKVFLNQQALGHHWIRLELIGTKCNRDAIGAQVEVVSGDLDLTQTVMPTRSYLSQVEKTLTFGLGMRTELPLVKITWPDGQFQEFPIESLDRTYIISQSFKEN